MPSAIGGLTPEYRGADIRCGLNERLGCGTKLPFDRTDRMTGSLLDCIKPRPPRYEGISSFLAGQNRSQKKERYDSAPLPRLCSSSIDVIEVDGLNESRAAHV